MRKIHLALLLVAALFALFLATITTCGFAAASEFANPAPVTIQGYEGHAMEPFVSRDGRILFFNNLNEPGENTDIHWAEHVKGLTFQYRGKVEGVNTDALEGVPSMDRDGVFYFISTRSYAQTQSTVYRGQFKAGKVTGVELVKGLAAKQPGHVIFDAAITPDGQFMYAAEGEMSGSVPKTADIFLARRVGDRFERVPDGAQMFVNINTADALEYAPAISHDGLELFFTRTAGSYLWRKTTIEHTTRRSVTDPFAPSKTVAAVEGFVEAPAVTANGKHLFYHAKVDGTHRIFCVSRK